MIAALSPLVRRAFSDLRVDSDRFQNPRTRSGLTPESIAGLGLNIGLLGLLVPLIILPDGTIIAGQRRYRAIEWLLTWSLRPISDGDAWNAMTRDLSAAEVMELRDRASAFVTEGVLVRECSGDYDAIAVGDNLHEPLSSYELAVFLHQLHEAGVKGREISRMVGKSQTWVSRKLSAFRGAGTALRRAWQLGEVSEERVQQLAELAGDEQEARLAMGAGAPPRGPAHRPKIDDVKDVLHDLEQREAQLAREPSDPRRAELDIVIQTLRWVAGQPASERFVRLLS